MTPTALRADLAVVLAGGDVEVREAGDGTIGWVSAPAGFDLAPLPVGLPGGACSCPHAH